MKFKYLQAPVLFSSTFKALHLAEKKFKYFQGLSRMCGNPEFRLNKNVTLECHKNI